jgi:transcriptional regulator with XRE-family HTH domain
MPRSRPRLTLGGRIEHRRKQLGLSQAAAARRVGVSRTTWRAWEKDGWEPEGFNHARIEEFCDWEPGSVAAVLDGRAPTPLREATVTALHPGATRAAAPEDEFVTELRAMGLPEQFLNDLIAAYWSEKDGEDVRRRQRYLNLAREAGH